MPECSLISSQRLFEISVRYETYNILPNYNLRHRLRPVGIALSASRPYTISRRETSLKRDYEAISWPDLLDDFVAKLTLTRSVINYALAHGQCTWPIIRAPQLISVASLPVFWMYGFLSATRYHVDPLNLVIADRLFASFPFVRDDKSNPEFEFNPYSGRQKRSVDFGQLYEKRQGQHDIPPEEFVTLLAHLLFTVYGFSADGEAPRNNKLNCFSGSLPYVVDFLQVLGYTTVYQDYFITAESEEVVREVVTRLKAGRASHNIAVIRIKDANRSIINLCVFPHEKKRIIIDKDVLCASIQDYIQDETEGLGGLYYGDSSFPYGTPTNPLICPPRK